MTAPGAEEHRQAITLAPGSMQSIAIPSRFAAEAAATNIAGTTNGTTGGTGSARTTVDAGGTVSGVSSNAIASGNGASTATNPTSNNAVAPVQPPAPGLIARVGAGPFIVFGVGVASTIAGAVFLVVRDGEFARAMCMPEGAVIRCASEQAQQAFIQGGAGAPDPYTPHTVATAAFAAGGVMLTAGALWFAISASRSSSQSERSGGVRASLLPSFNTQRIGLQWVGTF